MAFIFKGRLCGFICAECPEPLSRVRVRLYRLDENLDIKARTAASAKETFAMHSEDEARARERLLIAETETDDEGNFSAALGEKERYSGEAFDVDVRIETVPGLKSRKGRQPIQFTITTLQPEWTESREGRLAIWKYCLPFRIWCAVRARFGAWAICGRLTVCQTSHPVAGATVSAFDADWLQDDALGSGVTDATGRFRIDYTFEDFRRTPFSPIINFELVGGPDVYFKAVLGPDVILDEDRSIARTPGRENIGHCFCVELCTPDPLIGFIDTPTAGECVQSVQVTDCLTGGAPLNAVEITGTAAGGAFDHYTLSYSYGGPTINHAVVYPNCDRPPAHPSSSTQVTSGTLGWLDVNLLPPGVTEFTIHLDVFDNAAGSVSDTRTFTLRTRAIEITAVAEVNAVEGADPFQPASPHVKLIKDVNDPDPLVPEASIGGAFSLTGSAYVVGCDRILREFRLFRFDSPPSAPAPAPADATGGVALFSPPVQPVVYDDTVDHPWQSGCLFPTSNTVLNGVLTSQWSVDHCTLLVPPFTPYTVPKVKPIPAWNSGALNGRFLMMVEVKDGPVGGGGPLTVAGVDRVVVWIDNQGPTAHISSIGGLAPCVDLRLSIFLGTFAEVRGIAWDPPIDATAPQLRPNDNFGSYGLSFQKNGGSPAGIAVESHLGPPPPPGTFGSNVRVPNEWPAIISADGKLTDWDIVNALDLSSPTPVPGIPDAAKLARGERCAYVISLGVSDTTHVGDAGGGHSATALYAVNIINDIP